MHDQKFSKVNETLNDFRQKHANHETIENKLTRETEKLARVIAKNKDSANESLTKTREELISRIEELDRTQLEYAEENVKKHSEQKMEMNKNVKNLKDEFNTKLNNDIHKLREYVKDTTEKVNRSNNDIYDQYENKLRTIKDVCAQYFSKYEKHLINHQTIVKDLERQQEKWVEMLIKPQELNQARLFSIESRIKENEHNKMREFDFVKETIKKLIYAMEQQQMSSVRHSNAGGIQPMQSDRVRSSIANASLGGQLPTLMGTGKSRQAGTTRASMHQRGLSLTSQPIGFFGQTGEDINTISPEEDTKSKMSTLPPMSQKTQGNQLPSSSEVLFLKRLLYLKASIDNESTINAMSVPFE